MFLDSNDTTRGGNGKLLMTMMAWMNMPFNKYASCIVTRDSELRYGKADRLIERLIKQLKVCDSDRKYERDE